MGVRHVIVDRDGVLNEEAPNHGYIVRPDMWRWLPGSLEGLVALSRAGIRISVASNQSGVGRGLMSERDLLDVHERMLRDANLAGASLAGVFVCPHAPGDGCECRKPAPGLIERAIDESGIPVAMTLVVGDDLRDLEAAKSAGVRAALVLTGKGQRTAQSVTDGIVRIYENLGALAACLIREQDPSEMERTQQ